jgi:hypothetical protein
VGAEGKIMRRTIIAITAVMALLVAANSADAASSGWKVYSYNASGNALSSKQAPAGTASIAEFTFSRTPDDALLAMKASGSDSSILGKTITATFAIVGAGTYTYWGEGTADNPCGTPANTRLYFNTANGPFAYTKYWWSNPAAAFLTAPGTGTVTATVEPAEWSDWNGQNGATDPAAFADAASNPDLIGLSFGGGCFFENGVGVDPGSATFKLISYEIH